MIALAAILKSVHLGALALLIGICTFLLVVVRPAFRQAPEALDAERAALDRALMRLALASVAVAIATIVAWLWAHAIVVTESLALDGLLGVLAGTQFGRMQQGCFALLAMLGALWWLREREADDRDWVALRLQGAIVGAALVAAVSWIGHAGATEGREGVVHLLANSLHLVAASVWLGGLVPLAVLLARARTAPALARAPVILDVVRRFSALGLASVVTLMLTGFVNAWILVGSVPALVGTPYGRLLLVKLALVLPLLALAAVNRRRLTPQLRRARSRPGRPPLLARLRRHVIAEAALGAVILLIVGVLGVTPPGRHVPPSWPFATRLSWEANNDRADVAVAMVVAGVAVLLGALVVAYGLTRRPRRPLVVATGLVLIGYYGATPLQFLAIDAYPTTYLRPAVPYSGLSVANGARLYGEHCAACHGRDGDGDGPVGQALPVPPANLTAKHTADHTAGDLFWWLTHGIRGTPMPGFADRLSADERWDVINFLRALAAAEQARSLGPVVDPTPSLAAPDFVFGTGVDEPATLREHRGWAMVHLVLFTLPGSVPRLEELDRAWDKIGGAGARVIAVPMREAGDVYRRLGLRALNFPIAVDGADEITQTYALFRRTAASGGVPPVPTHLEFLIDRQGYIRARWVPGESAGWKDTARLLAEVQRLDNEVPRAPAPDEHVH